MNLRNMTSIYIFDGDDALMIRRVGSRVFSGTLWCGIGGHFEPDELNEPNQCILRELLEETGLRETDIADLTLKYITMRKKDDEIRQQYIYFATFTGARAGLRGCDEGELRWIKSGELLTLDMSYTNKECLTHYFQTGIKDNFIYIGAVKANQGVPDMVFTALGDFDTSY